MPKRKKEFLFAWSGKFYTKGSTETHGLGYVNEDNGYDDKDRYDVEQLEVGDTVTIEPGHTVTRTK